MTAYRYPLPRAYRRVRYPYRFKGSSTGTVPAWVIAAMVLVGAAGTGAGAKAVTSHGHPKPAVKSATRTAAAAEAIAFARAQLGKPYLWGGTGPDAFDCSGLVQAAWASAGVTIARTSQDQWASQRHVTASQVTAGDLVFFAGSDGTPSSPGHVGIVVDPARHLMIDAYATGTDVRYDTYGPAASPETGLSAVVGFTDPDPAAPPRPKAAVPAGTGETQFFAAVLSDLGAPATGRNLGSLAAWAAHEGPWGTVGQWNPLDTTLGEPGSTWFNTFYSNGVALHVQNYPTAAEGAQATASTLAGGYPLLTAALRSGAGVCGGGFADELGRWSGAYRKVC